MSTEDAAQYALDLRDEGKEMGLAIWMASQKYSVDTKSVSRALNKRKKGSFSFSTGGGKSKGLFADAEAGTPLHNEVSVWAKSKAASNEIFSRTVGVRYEWNPRTEIETPITTGKNNFLYGFADLLVEAGSLLVLAEIKTGSINLGELLRQLKGYQAAINKSADWDLFMVLLHLEPTPGPVFEALRDEGVLPIRLERVGEYSFQFADSTSNPLSRLACYEILYKQLDTKIAAEVRFRGEHIVASFRGHGYRLEMDYLRAEAERAALALKDATGVEVICQLPDLEPFTPQPTQQRTLPAFDPTAKTTS